MSLCAEMLSSKQAGSLAPHTWFPALCTMVEVEGRQDQVLEPVPKALRVEEGGTHIEGDFRWRDIWSPVL